MMGTRNRAREWALNLGATLGVLCILWTFAAAAFGLTPLVFRSGSMSPAISTGALGLATEVPASDVRVGDVVSVDGADGVRVTHRVEQARLDGDAVVLTLRGDANQSPDASTYRVTQVDRVLFDVPLLGYVVSAAASPIGVLLGVGAVGGLLWLGFAGSLAGAAVRRHRVVLVAGVVTALAVGALAAPTVSTLARWSDTASMKSGDVQAYTVPTTPTFTCTTGNRTATFTWAAVPGADSYIFHYGTTGQTTNERTSTTATLSLASGTASGVTWVEVKRTFGSVSWTSVASVTRDYTLGFRSSCD
ncbi:signal peptidase I [Nocardioides sp.]|uniref:signal peptidase I n=1 Tax=Nocardioides sp. TaxID=35761 RepID=UPI003D0D0712